MLRCKGNCQQIYVPREDGYIEAMKILQRQFCIKQIFSNSSKRNQSCRKFLIFLNPFIPNAPFVCPLKYKIFGTVESTPSGKVKIAKLSKNDLVDVLGGIYMK